MCDYWISFTFITPCTSSNALWLTIAQYSIFFHSWSRRARNADCFLPNISIFHSTFFFAVL